MHDFIKKNIANFLIQINNAATYPIICFPEENKHLHATHVYNQIYIYKICGNVKSILKQNKSMGKNLCKSSCIVVILKTPSHSPLRKKDTIHMYVCGVAVSDKLCFVAADSPFTLNDTIYVCPYARKVPV